MDRFEITYFYGPPEEFMLKEECIRDMAEAGITLCHLSFGSEINKKIIPLIEKYNMRAFVGSGFIYKAFWEKDEALARKAIMYEAKEYEDVKSVAGFNICDEPGGEYFPVLSAISEAMKEYAPEKEMYINLFPNYASKEQLGAENYEEYLEKFITGVKPEVLSYDHYHFLGRDVAEAEISKGDISEQERLIRIAAMKTASREGFFTNLESVRDAALRHNIKPLLIVLLSSHGPYRSLTYGEILWEVNMCLAYGMKRLSYFTYWQPEYDEFWRYENGFCDRDGKKCPHYYDVKDINLKVAPIGEILYPKKSLGVFHLGAKEEKTKEFTSFGNIKEILGESAVIGFFEEGLAYLVNRDFASENTLIVKGEAPLEIYKDGEFQKKEKSFKVTLKPGEGILIK